MKQYKELSKLGKEDKDKKLKELQFELVKKSIVANRASKIKTKEIKKNIARILTSNTQTS
jgi:ribosomal protein L29